MTLYDISFYFFSIVAILSALTVVSSKNPVHSVLFLILSFVNASAIFILFYPSSVFTNVIIASILFKNVLLLPIYVNICFVKYSSSI